MEILAQDVADFLTNQRNASMNEAATLYAQLMAAQRRIAELESERANAESHGN